MSASTTDKITDVRNSARPNTARVTTARVASASSLACDSLTGWPTASKVHFVTYQVDTNNNVISGTQLDCSGIVSANTLTNIVVIDGTDGGNSVGDIVEMLPTAAWGQDLADGLMAEHDRFGAHNSTAASTLAPLISDALGAILYPIGSIYINATVSTNPSTLLGFGTWTAFGAGRVPVGIDGTQTEFDTIGETGGAKTHTHTVPLTGYSVTEAAGNGRISGTVTGIDGKDEGITSTMTTDSGSTLMPYITVYMWKRTA